MLLIKHTVSGRKSKYKSSTLLKLQSSFHDLNPHNISQHERCMKICRDVCMQLRSLALVVLYFAFCAVHSSVSDSAVPAV